MQFKDFNDIKEICKKFNIRNYNINNDGTVDVNGNVWLEKNSLVEFPIKFGVINGDFDCSRNMLTSLKGSPSKVNGNYYCNDNELKSLEFAPKKIGGNFNCSNNNLTNLDHSPLEVIGYYNFKNTDVTTTKYITRNCKSYILNSKLYKELLDNSDIISSIITNQYKYTIWYGNEIEKSNFAKMINDIRNGKAY